MHQLTWQELHGVAQQDGAPHEAEHSQRLVASGTVVNVVGRLKVPGVQKGGGGGGEDREGVGVGGGGPRAGAGRSAECGRDGRVAAGMTRRTPNNSNLELFMCAACVKDTLTKDLPTGI
jgi:hypothetical protein